jgi:hypothetical protein
VIFTHLLQSASLIPTDASALESSISALETAISALEAEIRALDNRSVPWEHALPWFTFAVLVGVALEWWVIRRDFREEMEAWAIFDFIGVVRSPSRPSVRKLVVEIASVALIVFGIFGELGIGLKIASINSSLRAKSADLRSKNADLRSKSDRLVALLNKKTEGLKAENLTLEAQIAPRRLTPAQQRAVTENCSKFKSLFAGKRVKLVSYWLDTESLILDFQIANSLRMKPCEMFVDDEAMSILPGLGTFSWGISTFGSDSELAKKIADAISRNGGPITAGFSTTDLTAGTTRLETANSRLPHEATVLVGPKMLDPETVKELNRITPAASPTSR